MASILVVEDDEELAVGIALELTGRGHEVRVIGHGTEAVAILRGGGYDAVTLDRIMPGMDGLSIVATLRREGVTIPVLMISALSDVDDRIDGIRAGGDDYLVKPFAPAEMVVRMEALLRRTAGAAPANTLRAGTLTLDLLARRVERDGRPIALYPTEFRLLELFVRNEGRPLSRSYIFQAVWGYSFDPGTNAIAVHVARLRQKLDQSGRTPLIATVRGEGYRLDAD